MDEIEKIIIKHHCSIIKIAFAYVKNIHDAEDIAQEVFLSLLKNQITFNSEDYEKAWLIRACINKSKDHLKMSWFKKRSDLTHDITYLPKEEGDLLNFVMELDVKYRVPLHLFYYEDYSIDEIAKILNSNPKTVGTWIDRGRKKIKAKLGGFYYE